MRLRNDSPLQFYERFNRVKMAISLDGENIEDISQLVMAERIGVSQASVSQAFRKNSIPDTWLISILRKYKVNPDWIINGNPEMKYMQKCSFIEDSTDVQGQG